MRGGPEGGCPSVEERQDSGRGDVRAASQRASAQRAGVSCRVMSRVELWGFQSDGAVAGGCRRRRLGSRVWAMRKRAAKAEHGRGVRTEGRWLRTSSVGDRTRPQAEASEGAWVP